jgi:hypothetical protein
MLCYLKNKGDVIMATVNRGRYTTTLDLGLIKKIKELSDKTRVPQSKLLDEAIEDLLRKYEKGRV